MTSSMNIDEYYYYHMVALQRPSVPGAVAAA